MEYLHNFLFVTDNDEKLDKFIACCNKQEAIMHLKFLAKDGGMHGLCGRIRAVPNVVLRGMLQELSLHQDPNVKVFYVLDNQSYVCQLTDFEVDTAITVYNYARNIAYTTEGDLLADVVKDCIFKWLHNC